MENRGIHVPISLLSDSDQTPAAKVIWMALRQHPAAGPAELEVRTGLSRHTVLRGLAHTKGNDRNPEGPKVKMPGALLAERSVGARAKVLYGLLQGPPHFQGHSGEFTYTTLCAITKLGRNTLKRAIAELIGARWIKIAQRSRLGPIRFTLGTPDWSRSLAKAGEARRRLKRAKHVGEALMQEFLSLLIDSDQFTDNARPGYLVNPNTKERLELDRLYAQKVAFEFNGAHHYHKTGRFSQAEVEAQHLRDLIKAGICLYRGIHLVIIHAEDLSVHGMVKKIGRSMPLRNLAGQEPLIDLLEGASLVYRAAATAGIKQDALAD